MATRSTLASFDTILRDLAATTARMGADAIQIEGGFRWSKAAQEAFRRKLGATCRGDAMDLYPAGVRITVTRGDKAYPFSCATYPHHLDNLRIAQHTVSTLYQLFEVHGASAGAGGGVDAFDALFGAVSEALARVALGDGSPPPWHQTLGIPPDADRATIEAAHKLQARLNHPDKGGDTRTMALVNAARDEGGPERRGEHWRAAVGAALSGRVAALVQDGAGAVWRPAARRPVA